MNVLLPGSLNNHASESPHFFWFRAVETAQLVLPAGVLPPQSLRTQAGCLSSGLAYQGYRGWQMHVNQRDVRLYAPNIFQPLKWGSSKRLSSLAVWSFTFSFGDRCTAGSTRHQWVFIWGCCKSKRFIQQMHPSALQHSTWRQFTEIEWCFSEHKLKILKTQVKAPACSTKCCHELSYDM